MEEAIGVVAGHEKGHTERKNVKESHENLEKGTSHNVEARPIEIENEILNELKKKK